MERVNCLTGYRRQEPPPYSADAGLWDVRDSLHTQGSMRDSREAEWIYGADLSEEGANYDSSTQTRSTAVNYSVPGFDETFCLTPGLNYNEQVQIRHRQVCAPSGVLNVSHWVSVLRRVCWVSCCVNVLSCGPCSLGVQPGSVPRVCAMADVCYLCRCR